MHGCIFVHLTTKQWVYMSLKSIKLQIRNVIFRSDFPAGKLFDVILLVMIVMAVAAVMLESVERFDKLYHKELLIFEWVITVFFTIEYALRIWVSPKPWAYIRSFYGIVDLISILPSYLSLFSFSSKYLSTVRALRLLRIFRIFKLSHYLGEMKTLVTALKASQAKITVFLTAVLTSTIVLGSVMYLIEGAEAGFTSIPRSIYWAIVTLTTVGYGDIAPVTTLGQTVAALVMILGFGIIAVPTGIVSAELSKTESTQSPKGKKGKKGNKVNDIEQPQFDDKLDCPICGKEQHLEGANYCIRCGSDLPNNGHGDW